MSSPAGVGTSPYFSAALTNTKVAVRTSRTLVFYLMIANPNATDCWVQMFDAASAGITLGTTVPDRVFLVPGASVLATNDGGITQSFDPPLQFSTALTIAATTTATGLTAPGSNLTIDLEYIGG